MSARNTNTTTLEVPTEMVEQIRRMMEELSTAGQTGAESSARSRPIVIEDDDPDDYKSYEITKIMDHRIRNGEFEFKLRFKGGEVDWVADRDCNCEWLISQYLLAKGISTAFIICRVSTKEQAASTNLSLDGQEASIRELIPEGVYDRVKVLKIAQSAYRSIPKKMQCIGEAAVAGDAIFVYRVDRLSRNIEKYLYWLRDLDQRDVKITAVLDTSAMIDGAPAEGESHVNTSLDYRTKRLTFIQAVLDAEKESAILSQKSRVAVQRRLARGDEHVGGLAYGKKYQRSDDGTGRLIVVIDPELEEIQNFVTSKLGPKITKIQNSSKEAGNLWTLHLPKLVDIVVKQLNGQGLLKRGRKWTRSMLYKFMGRQNICGLYR